MSFYKNKLLDWELLLSFLLDCWISGRRLAFFVWLALYEFTFFREVGWKLPFWLLLEAVVEVLEIAEFFIPTLAQREGILLQTNPFSTTQSELQPSPLILFLSSHYYNPSTNPFPQTGGRSNDIDLSILFTSSFVFYSRVEMAFNCLHFPFTGFSPSGHLMHIPFRRIVLFKDSH